MSSSFGQWYDERQAESNPDGSSGSWFGREQVLPLFNAEGMQNLSMEGIQNFSFESMKQSMEASMPKKVMGLSYQQRFKVSGRIEVMPDRK